LAALHASMLTTLVYRFGPPGTGRAETPSRALANGQCLVFRPDALRAAGGFRATAGHLTDDVAVARHLASQGWRVGFLDGTHVVEVRMHESAADAWSSWGRSLPMPDLTPPWRQVADLGVVWLAQGLPLVRALTRRGDLLDGLLLALRVGTLVVTRRAYVRPGLGSWLAPLADLPVAARLTQGAVLPERTWRGRTYQATELAAPSRPRAATA
jgi:dolichol-phosphate mannosyltransferase